MDKEEQKKAIYDSLSSRRRKFIDRIGYETWDPFQEPNHPIDIRRDPTGRTASQLIKAFFRDMGLDNPSNAYSSGVHEMCGAVFSGDERYRGMYEFCQWYIQELQRRDIDPRSAWERK